MRTETLLKLLALGQMQLWEIFEAMGGTVETVQEAINDALEHDLITWRHCFGGRFYYLKEST